MTKYFIDTEFFEDGNVIDLISIGIVGEDGREYYAESKFAKKLATSSDWLIENVYPHLRGGEYVKFDDEIADDIISFVGEDPEFWSYYADYDWVALCQLYGRMIDLPPHFPMMCMDIKQLRIMGNFKWLPAKVGAEHDALEDARWHKAMYDYMKKQIENGKNVLELK